MPFVVGFMVWNNNRFDDHLKIRSLVLSKVSNVANVKQDPKYVKGL